MMRCAARNMRCVALLFCGGMLAWAPGASAFGPENIVDRYSDCRISYRGEGIAKTMILEATIHYRVVDDEALGNRNGNVKFNSRALVLYAFDKNGQPNAFNIFKGWLEEQPGIIVSYSGGRTSSMRGLTRPWLEQQPLVARARIEFLTRDTRAGLRSLVFSGGNYVTESKQYLHTLPDRLGVYFSIGPEYEGCRVVDPNQPLPPPDIVMTVNAPDWDLGEIRRGEQTFPFSASSDQLCLTYSDTQTKGQAFIVNATSQNGELDNRFQLKQLQDDTQSIPYQLLLDSGTQQLQLPNAALKSLPLNNGDKTCFMPTFKTFAPQTTKKGDYSDVLTFTIVTKS